MQYHGNTINCFGNPTVFKQTYAFFLLEYSNFVYGFYGPLLFLPRKRDKILITNERIGSCISKLSKQHSMLQIYTAFNAADLQGPLKYHLMNIKHIVVFKLHIGQN